MDYVSYYEPGTGQIKASYGGLCLDRMDEIYKDLSKIDGIYEGKSSYVKDGAIAERPTFTSSATPVSIPADGVSIVTISGFPADSTLTISGPINETWTETEITTELTVNLPGSYKVRIENWPYQDAEVAFNAT